jgi:hypothetical protein
MMNAAKPYLEKKNLKSNFILVNLGLKINQVTNKIIKAVETAAISLKLQN